MIEEDVNDIMIKILADNKNAISTPIKNEPSVGNNSILKIGYLVIFLFEICIVLDERGCSLSVIIFSARWNFRFD